MPRQLEYFKEYKRRVESAIGKQKMEQHIKRAVFLISAGTNDFIVNYYALPIRRKTYTLSGYQQFLLQQVKQFLQVIWPPLNFLNHWCVNLVKRKHKVYAISKNEVYGPLHDVGFPQLPSCPIYLYTIIYFTHTHTHTCYSKVLSCRRKVSFSKQGFIS